jgi:DNA-binding CsgD family transcriptional regulator
VPQTTKERVRQMTEAGLTPQQIALALRVTTQNVYKHMKALGLDPPSKQEKSA